MDDAGKLRGPDLGGIRPVGMRQAETAKGHLSSPLPLSKTMFIMVLGSLCLWPVVSPGPASVPQNAVIIKAASLNSRTIRINPDTLGNSSTSSA